MSCITSVLIHKLPSCVIPILSLGGALHAATPHPWFLYECAHAQKSLHSMRLSILLLSLSPSLAMISAARDGKEALFFSLSNAKESCLSFH